MKTILSILTAVLLCSSLFAQTVVSGRVTDAATGSPVPFANVYFKGSTVGMISDFDGYFEVSTSGSFDTLVVSYIGYIPRQLPVVQGAAQVLNIQLEEDIISLQEVVVEAGENPAYAIMRRVKDAKGSNDKRNLDAYEYESYTKTEFDINEMDEKFRNKETIRMITNIMDSIEHIAGEDGTPLLPLMFTEAISRFYYKKNPTHRTENILKTKVSGVGITDGTTTSQFIGSTFQEYNFYRNWLTILEKDFVSPLADSWRLFYEYYLLDSVELEGEMSYIIEFLPKREQDLAFQGTMWITKKGNALKQIDASVNGTSNLNFIDKLRIQQELTETEAGAWIPVKTRVLVDVSELTKGSAGILAKFYVSNRDIIVNKPYDEVFYRFPIKLDPEARIFDDDFWELNRHDPLTSTEVNVYRMIDTLKTVPFIRRTTNLTKFLANAYHPIGKIEIGPYTSFFANNDVEGYRVGLGFRTTLQFSNKWVIAGYMGYGFKDERMKYDASLKRIISRNPWTEITFQRKFEIDPVWILNDEISPLSLFYAYSRFGKLSDPFAHTLNSIDLSSQLSAGWKVRLLLKQQDLLPEFEFNYKMPDDLAVTGSQMTTTEINFETRWAKDELVVVNDNERLSMGTLRAPIITMRYTLGLKGVLNGGFNYHKASANISWSRQLGGFGRSLFVLEGSKVFSTLPYPLLKAHIGNESPFYIGFAYNLMDYYEFTTDQHAALRWRHNFEGLILNRVPLIRRLKWRLTASADIMAGSVDRDNLDVIVPRVDGNGVDVMPFRVMDSTPYVELGYGVENIFKFFRVDAFHRMTYTDGDARRFGVKFTIQFIL